jgi:beta-lactamase superfamily II metal-dependent hydrolase
MKVTIFNVEHGFCAFIKTPTGYGRLIDCGCTSTFSPAMHIAKYELPSCKSWNGYSLAHLTVTHPHNDHIEDTDTVIAKCKPYYTKTQEYDWDEVKAGEDGAYENLDSYSDWIEDFTPTLKADTKPDYGMKFDYFYLTPDEAKEIDEMKFINNSSIVTVATVTGSLYTEKFLFGGDMETAGWEALLDKDNGRLRKAVAGTDFFIASHHGHKSGFSEELYKAMGKPLLNIVSIHHGDEKIDTRYSQEEYASGVNIGGKMRRSLTTRQDGSITVTVNAEGKYSVGTEYLASNRKA